MNNLDKVLEKAPGVRVRPLVDQELLLAYSPTSRKLHWLNLGAWALFELCDGESEVSAIVAAYSTAFEGELSEQQVSGQVTAGLESLTSSGLIRAKA